VITEIDPSTTPGDPVIDRARGRVGRTLCGKWQLGALLGVGGMAAVYAATHRNGKRVAVKMLHTELSVDPNVRGRFLREGYVANRVGHPGAVSVSDDDVTEDGAVFLVMDLLEGETIEARWERKGRRLLAPEVLWIADALLDVLVAAHAHGIVHRDLKPENLFLTRDSVLKVLDFGIARLRELSTASTATQSGSTMGTPAFMPPEQARALWDEVDGRTDLWAVGATMFALLTGRLVHDGRTANEQLLSAMTRPAPPVRQLEPLVPRAVAEVVDRALAFHRDERWCDAATMQTAVRAAYAVINGSPISTAPRLVVPEIAATLVSDVDPRRPSTASMRQRTDGPVSSGQTGASHTPRAFPGVPRTIFSVGVAAVVLAAGGTIALLRTAQGERPAAQASAPGLSAAPEGSRTGPSSAGSPAVSAITLLGSPPVDPIDLDALPSVTGGASFVGKGGICKNVVVAGVSYGATPTAEVRLVPGDYLASCDLGDRKVRQEFSVRPDQSTHVEFTLVRKTEPARADPRDTRRR
jgi:eukaryotic-like serine/threonine-protein kinase